jgi:hypothetical protein
VDSDDVAGDFQMISPAGGAVLAEFLAFEATAVKKSARLVSPTANLANLMSTQEMAPRAAFVAVMRQ